MSNEVSVSSEKVQIWPIMISFLISGFIGMFSETALNIALSDLMEIFHITPSTVQWLTTIYLLTFGILVPVSGFFMKRFTTRQLFVTSLLFSVAGFAAAATAPSFEVLLAARVGQAIGSALLLPLMFNTVLLIFPQEKRGTAMGIVGFVIMSAPAVGPTLAGFITESMSWHWIFWISEPFLILSLLCGLRYMRNVSVITKPKIDVLSVVLSTIGFGGIVFGFSQAGEVLDWTSAPVMIPLIAGSAALCIFSLRQMALKQPVLNLRVFRYPLFTLGILLVILCMMVILASVILLPIYLQEGLGISMILAGLIMMPGGIINGIMSQVTGRLFDWIGPRGPVISGALLMTAVVFLLSRMTADTSPVFVIAMHSFLMMGTAMVMTAAQTNALNQLPHILYPDGTAIMTTLQQVAGAVGTALGMCFLSVGQQAYLAVHEAGADIQAASVAVGTQQAFSFLTLVSAAALVLSLFIKSSKR
jgi:DHA2 family lincomycin resistance protein-like MFS transporter